MYNDKYNDSDYNFVDVIYEYKGVRCISDIYGEIKTQAKCTECGCWFDLDIKNIKNNIKGCPVGDPCNPILCEYPYNGKMYVSECVGCGYIHVHSPENYEEITSFGAYDKKLTLKYVPPTQSGVVVYFPYYIYDAETISKYILSKYVKLSKNMRHDLYELIDLALKLEDLDHINTTLVSVMIKDMVFKHIDKTFMLTYTLLEQWASKGELLLDNDTIVQCNNFVNNMLLK